MLTRSILLFVLAALAEIGGAWLIWQGYREHRGILWIAAGIIALGAYGFVATFQPDPNFGRILAAYGGIFVAGSLAWGTAGIVAVSAPSSLAVDLARLHGLLLVGLARGSTLNVYSCQEVVVDRAVGALQQSGQPG